MKWVGIGLAATAILFAMVVAVIAQRASATLKNRITGTLRASFHGRVELDSVNVVSWHGFKSPAPI